MVVSIIIIIIIIIIVIIIIIIIIAIVTIAIIIIVIVIFTIIRIAWMAVCNKVTKHCIFGFPPQDIFRADNLSMKTLPRLPPFLFHHETQFLNMSKLSKRPLNHRYAR